MLRGNAVEALLRELPTSNTRYRNRVGPVRDAALSSDESGVLVRTDTRHVFEVAFEALFSDLFRTARAPVAHLPSALHSPVGSTDLTVTPRSIRFLSFQACSQLTVPSLSTVDIDVLLNWAVRIPSYRFLRSLGEEREPVHTLS